MTTRLNTASLPKIRSGQFEGPLDFLLDEVRRQNVAIENIAMAPMAARYLEYVRSAAECNLDLDIEWLHMAATLIDWKARALLPQNPGGADGELDPIREDLVRQLLARVKQAAEELDRRRTLEEKQFSRAAGVQFQHPSGIAEIEEARFLSVWDMLQQARDIARWVMEQRTSRKEFSVEKDDSTVAEMIGYLRARLDSEHVRIDAAALIHEQTTASRKACLFLGMLELMRNQQLQIEQPEWFGPMWILASTRSSDNAMS